MAVPPHDFAREFLSALFDHHFMSGLMSREERDALGVFLMAPAFESFSGELHEKSPLPVELSKGLGEVSLIELREMDGRPFPFLLARRRPPRRRRSALRCFLGHRFLPEIEGPLRHNLAYVLNHYGIVLKWSVQDLSAAPIFDDIVKNIRGAAMCFFDTRATAGRPNVFIEIGIALAFKVPMMISEFEGDESASAIPSDLQSHFRIRYRNYEQLFRTMYFGLPSFLRKHRLQKAR